MQSNLPDQADDKSAWSLCHWLKYLETIHSQNIDLGLARIREVFDKMQADFSQCNVITVAGTNGKGTTCAVLEQLAMAAGKRVGVYSSPHLLDYRERVRIDGNLPDEKQFCEAFHYVDTLRGDVTLTYFEFGTLAGFKMLLDAGCDLLLLEVGLGGRLDAVNLVDPDIAVITSVDLDHQDYLGDNRESIGAEKAGIFRPAIPVVIGDPEPPQSVIEHARQLQTQSDYQGRSFYFVEDPAHGSWRWQNDNKAYEGLPIPSVPLQNASTALAAWQHLGWPLSQTQVASALKQVSLPGRCQVLSRQPVVMADVAHNPQATGYLAQQIAKREYTNLHLVVGMLADKDIAASLAPLMSLEATWYCASLNVPRGATSEKLQDILVGQQKVLSFDSVTEACQSAIEHAKEHDLVVVFGSFFTVAGVLELTQS